jgi:hypothetical protein
VSDVDLEVGEGQRRHGSFRDPRTAPERASLGIAVHLDRVGRQIDQPERKGFLAADARSRRRKAASDRLEAGAKEMGFLDYFDQVNFSGSAITPDALNGDMIGLAG